MIVNAPQFELPAPQARQWLRNARCPDSWWASVVAAQANQAAAYMGKEVCRFSCPIANIPASVPASTRGRWRNFFRTGPYARYLQVRAVMAQATGAGGAGGDDPYATWALTAHGGAALGTLAIHFGASDASPADVPSHFGIITTPFGAAGVVIEVTPNTQYSGLWSDEDGSRLVSVTAQEISLDTTTANDYAPTNYTAGSPILDADRDQLTRMARSLWKDAGSHLWNFSVNVDASPRTRTSATAINPIDNSSTTVSAATPGVTLDLRNLQRLAGTGVPVRMAVYASTTAGGTGVVRIKDSGGTTMGSITVTATSGSWTTTDFELPATRAKYDLTIEGDGTHALTFNAMSLFRYEA